MHYLQYEYKLTEGELEQKCSKLRSEIRAITTELSFKKTRDFPAEWQFHQWRQRKEGQMREKRMELQDFEEKLARIRRTVHSEAT